MSIFKSVHVHIYEISGSDRGRAVVALISLKFQLTYQYVNFQQQIYSIKANFRPSVRLSTTFRGKRDFLGPYLRQSFATYGCLSLFSIKYCGPSYCFLYEGVYTFICNFFLSVKLLYDYKYPSIRSSLRMSVCLVHGKT